MELPPIPSDETKRFLEEQIRKLLETSFSEDDNARFQAVAGLTQRCTREEIPLRGEILQRMSVLIKDPSPTIRLEVANGFSHLGNKAWDKAWQERNPSLLGEDGLREGSMAAENLLALTQDSDNRVQRRALSNLGIFGFLGIKREEIEQRILEILAETRERNLFETAIDQQTLINPKDPRVRKNLEARAQSSDETRKSRAQIMLAEIERMGKD